MIYLCCERDFGWTKWIIGWKANSEQKYAASVASVVLQSTSLSCDVVKVSAHRPENTTLPVEQVFTRWACNAAGRRISDNIQQLLRVCQQQIGDGDCREGIPC